MGPGSAKEILGAEGGSLLDGHSTVVGNFWLQARKTHCRLQVGSGALPPLLVSMVDGEGACSWHLSPQQHRGGICS